MSAPHWLRIQLSGPTGFLARPMAHLLNRINGADYQRALERLDANPGETVLELGFGGGLGVEALLRKGVRVMAAEPSESLRARGYRRWAWPLARQELELWPHTAETLPERSVDRALSMNTVYFWDDIDAGFANLAKMVTTRVLLGIASPVHLRKAGFDKEGFRLEEIPWYAERLSRQGFHTEIVPPADSNGCGLLIGNK